MRRSYPGRASGSASSGAPNLRDSLALRPRPASAEERAARGMPVGARPRAEGPLGQGTTADQRLQSPLSKPSEKIKTMGRIFATKASELPPMDP